jgi:hypothetical protein
MNSRLHRCAFGMGNNGSGLWEKENAEDSHGAWARVVGEWWLMKNSLVLFVLGHLVHVARITAREKD